MRKTRYLWLIALILAAAGTCIAMAKTRYFGNYRMTLSDGVYRALMNELSVECVIPRGGDAAPSKRETMIYVLGSTQERLRHHYGTAAALYKEGVADRIYILSRPGITEYSPKLRRNLTNDEWSVRELGRLGVPARDVEAVPVPSGIFGTFGEGRRITRFAQQRGYKSMVLVSSPHHTRRVHLTFSHFAGGAVDVYVCGSSDPASLVALFVEYGKHLCYRGVLIPVDRLGRHARKGVPASRKAASHLWNAESIPDRIARAALLGT